MKEYKKISLLHNIFSWLGIIFFFAGGLMTGLFSKQEEGSESLPLLFLSLVAFALVVLFFVLSIVFSSKKKKIVTRVFREGRDLTVFQKYCSKCGAANAKGNSRCTSCGEALEEDHTLVQEFGYEKGEKGEKMSYLDFLRIHLFSDGSDYFMVFALFLSTLFLTIFFSSSDYFILFLVVTIISGFLTFVLLLNPLSNAKSHNKNKDNSTLFIYEGGISQMMKIENGPQVTNLITISFTFAQVLLAKELKDRFYFAFTYSEKQVAVMCIKKDEILLEKTKNLLREKISQLGA